MDYIYEAVVTANEDLSRKELILNGALGLCRESGEVADIIRKYAFQGHYLNMDKLKDELGDVFWYIALLCDVCGFTFEEIQEHNINKLKKRYPGGFEEQKSINRDELEVLSQKWIDEHAYAVAYDGMPDDTEVVYVDDLQNLLVPSQELPVIPKFVADWVQEVKPDNSLRVAFEYVAQRKRENYDDELAFWIEEGNSETFARAWLDGFTVDIKRRGHHD